MSAAAKSGAKVAPRLQLDPPRGRMPTLQFVLIGELQVDHTYQRSADGEESRALIRRIAQRWNWDLCQPLVVARRASSALGGYSLFVIDGQHRLEAARLRGDIAQLPCVVVEYAGAAEEAASFVHLNQQRRPLTKLEVFRAAIASGDERAVAINAAIGAAGLTVARHMTAAAWKPGQIGNIGGIEAAWSKHGEQATCDALAVLEQAWRGQVLQYAGTVFPGLVAVCASWKASERAAGVQRLAALAGKRSQVGWRSDVLAARAADPSLGMTSAAVLVFEAAWAGRPVVAAPAPTLKAAAPAHQPSGPKPTGRAGWCDQCDLRVTETEASGCRSRFCKMKVAA